MMYSVKISEQAEKDLRGIFEYISLVLNSTQYAVRKLRKLDEAISKLNYMPERYRKYEKEPWHSGMLQEHIIEYFSMK